MKNLVNLALSAVTALFAGGCYGYYEPVSSSPKPAYTSESQPVCNPTPSQPINPQPVTQPNLITESQERVEHIQMHHNPNYAQGPEYNSTQEHIDAEIRHADPNSQYDIREAKIREAQIRQAEFYRWLAEQKARERAQGIRTTPHKVTRR